MRIEDLDTPALVLERDRLDANLARMSARAKALGVDLRPHLKTAKSAEIARRATAPHSGAITVSTLREADYFVAQGFTDLLYGVGAVPDKLPRVAALQSGAARVAMVTDQVAVARALGETAAALGGDFAVLVEIDCGDGRAGVAPESDDLLEIGRVLDAAANVALRGVMTHAGHSYACRNAAEVGAVA